MVPKAQNGPFKPFNRLFLSVLVAFLFILQGSGPFEPKAAVGPMEYYYGLVAGQGDIGYRDGAFNQVLFQEPSGLALNPEETTLYVSDAGNHVIRAIDLEHQNTVSTLVGTHTQGFADGSFKHVSFFNPRNLAMLPNNILAVYDSGNGSVRLVDLKGKTVSTWFQATPRRSDGQSPDPVNSIYNMVYSTTDKVLYYSQPQLQKVMKIALGQTQPSEAFPTRTECSLPGPLVLHQDKLLVGSLNDGSIFPLEALQNTATAATPLAKTESIAALASVGSTLFALPRNGEKVLHPLDNTFTYMPTSEGDPSTVITFNWFLRFNDTTPPQWIASANSEKKFYITSATNPVGVYYLKDYNFTVLKDKSVDNTNALSDFEYPVRKPKGTFRILMIGDSHTFFVVPSGTRPIPEYSRMLSIPKRLEWALNAKAALNNSPVKYEVLFLGHEADEDFPISLWPYYNAPAKVAQYDADLVLFMAVPQVHQLCTAWFQRQITSDGIPSGENDVEYFQKPWTEKAPEGTVRRHYLDLCIKKNLVTIADNKFGIDFAEAPYILREPDLVDDAIEMTGKPLGLLSKKIGALRTKAGASIPFVLCNIPFSTHSMEDYNRLWLGIVKKNNLKCIDLSSRITALRESRLPAKENGHEHFSPEGHDLIAQLLADALVKEHWVPLKP